MGEYRSGAWNVYFLGFLKEAFEEQHIHRNAVAGATIDATCYTYGTAPDTILNFGWSRHPRYLEINNNGRLNLKVSLDQCATDDEKRRLLHHVWEEVHQLVEGNAGVRREAVRLAGSATVAYFDIGLQRVNGALQFGDGDAAALQANREHSLQRLGAIVLPFYAPGR